MRKTERIVWFSALLLAGLFVVSCSGGKPVGTATQSARASSLSPVTTQAPQASPAAPSPVQWPMATPAPQATPFPSDAPLTADDYYVVYAHSVNEPEVTPSDSDEDYTYGSDNIDRCGVVDRRGNIIVPIVYYNVNILSEPQTGGKIYFYATTYGFDHNTLQQAGDGYLFGADGKRADNTEYRSLEDFMPGLICATRNDGKVGIMDYSLKTIIPFEYSDLEPIADGLILATRNNGKVGIMDYSLKTVIPFDYSQLGIIAPGLLYAKKKGGNEGVIDLAQHTMIPFNYSSVQSFGDLIAAVSGARGKFKIDFYDLSGVKKGSLAVGGSDICVSGDILAARGKNGKFGIIDETMKWICPPRWVESVRDDPDGNTFTIDVLWNGIIAQDSDSSDESYYDRYGKPFLPAGYSDIDACYTEDNDDPAQTVGGHSLFRVSGDLGVALMDDTGRVLVHTDKAHDLDSIKYYDDGVIVMGGEAFRIDGTTLLPGVSYIKQWIPEEKLFICADACYREDGTKLPLPACDSIEVLAADRFLILTNDNQYGICNGEGQWLVPPGEGVLQWYGGYNNNVSYWPVFSTDKGWGLMDNNGNVVIPAVCNYIDNMGDGVYEIEYGGETGLVDASGHCFWHTSSYDALSD